MNVLNLNKVVENRKLELERRILELDKLKSSLKICGPYEFEISEIVKPNSKKKGEKVGLKNLSHLEIIKGAVIYFYEIIDLTIKPEILERLTKFRSKDNKDELGNDLRRSTAKIPNNVKENNTNILYVGSVAKNIVSRTNQHLGLGHKKTFALHLNGWAQPSWKFKFYYIEIDNPSILTDLEAQIAIELNPLLGKREK